MLNSDRPVDRRYTPCRCRTTLGIPQRYSQWHVESNRFPGRRRSVLSLSSQGVLFTGQRVFSGQPESTGVGPPTSSLPASTGSSNTVTTTGNTATNTSSNSSGGGSNVGAIAGGVVGGLAGLGILTALVVWYIMKRKRSQVAPSSAYMNSSQPPNKFNPPNYEPPLTPSAPPSPMRMTYNPSDPSTFPTAFHDPSIGTNSAYPQTLYDPNAARMGRYSGAPEI